MFETAIMFDFIAHNKAVLTLCREYVEQPYKAMLVKEECISP